MFKCCCSVLGKVKVEVKCTHVQALKFCIGPTAHGGEGRGIALLFLNHGTRRGEGPAARPGSLYTRQRAGTHYTGGWVGPRAGLDRCGKSRSHPDSLPGPSSPWPVAIQTELPGPRSVQERSWNATGNAMFFLWKHLFWHSVCAAIPYQLFKFKNADVTHFYSCSEHNRCSEHNPCWPKTFFMPSNQFGSNCPI